MAKLVSGRDKTVPPGEVDASRYEFLHPGQAEPNLGEAAVDGYVLSYNSSSPGKRQWVASSAGSQGTSGVQGAQGIQGVKFSTFIGAAPPGSPSAGDIWWDSESGIRYIWYTDVDSSQWVQESAPGALGPQGVSSSGSQGVQGSFGLQGLIGVSVQGIAGSAASQGATGTQGVTGSQGSIGIATQGIAGSAASQGLQGVAGSQGSSGISVQGISGSSAASATITDDNSTDASRYVMFTNQTSGTLSTTYVSSTKLQYNPSNGTVTATDFSATSDGRFKTVLGSIEDPLQKVLMMRGVRYNWNDLAFKSGIKDDREQVGVIAQEIAKILPQAVEQTNLHLSVKYDKLVPLLIEAIKELNTTVNELQKQISNKN